MKYLLLLTFIFSSSVFAKEYLVHSNYHEYKVLKALLVKSPRVKSVESVFTPAERKLLKQSKVNKYILKLDMDEKDMPLVINPLKMKFNFSIESNARVRFQSDPLLERQWGLKNNGEALEQWLTDIDLLRVEGIQGEDTNALDLKETNNEILVAIVDSGIDVGHPDLKDNILYKDKECTTQKEYEKCLEDEQDDKVCHNKYAKVDHDNNGYPLDCTGWNVAGKVSQYTGLQGNNVVFDRIGHGTHVAGIVGAIKNKIGVRGIVQNVKILPVQVNGSNQEVDLAPGETATDIIAKGLLYAIKSGAQVINLSLGWSLNEDSLLMRQMIEMATEKKILVVAAGGNSHHAGPTYPCSYAEVICVGSHTVNGKLSTFSNFGASIDIVAPGTQILSTWPMHKRPRGFTEGMGYEYMGGTSQAAPFVTGALAKLLNLGHTPEVARIKLLTGARKQTQGYIRHGNLDVRNSHLTPVKSFLYPLNKTAMLIKWEDGKTRKFKLKMKNYGRAARNIRLSLSTQSGPTQQSIDLLNKNFVMSSWAAGETKEFEIKFISEDDIESDIYFKLAIKTNDEEKSYNLHTQALTIVTDAIIKENTLKQDVANSEFLSGATIRAIEGFDTKKEKDFIAIKEVNGKTFVALIKYENGSYNTSKSLPLPLKGPIFLKFSRVDLELDGKSEYVLTLVDLNSDDKTRYSKFFVLDGDFKPYRYEITTKNTFDNELSVLPGSFLWLKHQGKMRPAWIGFGKRPENEIPAATPWEDAPIEYSQYHLYMLVKEGIKTFAVGDDETQPVSFLYQSPDQKAAGKVSFISSQGLGYFKNYQLHHYADKVTDKAVITLNRFHDLLSKRPLPISSAADAANAFFFTASVAGAQNVTMFTETANGLEIDQEKVPSFSKYDPIVHVLNGDQSGFIYQTRHHIGFYDRTTQLTSKVESKVNSKRIRHQLMKYSNALFLSSVYTPGIASEVLASKQVEGTQVIYRSAKWRMLGAKSCEEIGLIQENSQDWLTFFCSDTSRFIKISY
jgi:hypothetical protein